MVVASFELRDRNTLWRTPRMAASTPLDIVHDLETYLGAHDLDGLVKQMMVECFKTRPEDPRSWMMKYMLKQSANDGTATSECALASTSDSSTIVAVSQADSATQQYLTDKKVHVLFLELLKQVVAEKPDNLLSFVAQAAHNLQKAPPLVLQ